MSLLKIVLNDEVIATQQVMPKDMKLVSKKYSNSLFD